MKSNVKVGIDAISFYAPSYFVDLRTVAQQHNIDPDFYSLSIGQEKMAVLPPGEDVVTMAANAAYHVLESHDSSTIDTLIFATESGIDQSKAGGIYVHSLLGLQKRCRVFEIKQACYGATAGLQMAIPLVKQNPGRKVLIIASDVARYGLGTAGEPTQGGGAVAMLITANPRIAAFDEESGFYTEDVMDFWRPNYRDEALVDGKASVRIYIRSLLETWRQYHNITGRDISDFHRFCYHLPFTRMAEAAHKKLSKEANSKLTAEALTEQFSDSLYYNRVIGNTYAGSLYIGLISLLERSIHDLGEKRIALFSYGSGCMAEFFSATIIPGYRQMLCRDKHDDIIKNRSELTYDEYRAFYDFALPVDSRNVELPRYELGSYRLTEFRDQKRIYEKTYMANNHSLRISA